VSFGAKIMRSAPQACPSALALRMRSRYLSIIVSCVIDDAAGCRNDEGMVTIAAQFLFANLPPLDPDMKIARGIVEAIIEDREVTRVRHLVSRSTPRKGRCNGCSNAMLGRLRAG
jgi:hypothetical protein